MTNWVISGKFEGCTGLQATVLTLGFDTVKVLTPPPTDLLV